MERLGPISRNLLSNESHEIVESLLWPKRKIDAKYKAHAIITADGDTLSGYVLDRNAERILFRDPAKGPEHKMEILLDDLEAEREVGTLMPENLVGAMSYGQVYDLVSFLLDLGSQRKFH